MESSRDFWQTIDALVSNHPIVVDQPAGQTHPRAPQKVYPLDYGVLQPEGEHHIHVWVGSSGLVQVDGMLCLVDAVGGIAEVRLLLGCTAEEMVGIATMMNTGPVAALLVPRAAGG